MEESRSLIAEVQTRLDNVSLELDERISSLGPRVNFRIRELEVT